MLLAFTPQQSLSNTHLNHMPMDNTMSLAILPSTPRIQISTHLPPVQPSKRPKLSLNTANVSSSFGKKSTSLRLDTLSATSPTARNTFSNATFNPQSAPDLRLQQPALNSLATNILNDREVSPTDTASSNDSAQSASTIQSSSGEAPYSLSHHLTSILSNGPIPRSRPQKISFDQPKRTMFPATKKVAFRTPLEEEVITSKYTLRHIDIESSTSTISTLELSPPKEEEPQPCDSATEDDQKPSKVVVASTKKPTTSPHAGEKRESSDEEDSDTPAATPIAGRRKRSRHWVWTLPAPSSAIEKPSEAPAKDAEATTTA